MDVEPKYCHSVSVLIQLVSKHDSSGAPKNTGFNQDYNTNLNPNIESMRIHDRPVFRLMVVFAHSDNLLVYMGGDIFTCPLVFTEAGGVVSDAAGKPLDFSKGRYLDLDTGIIVTNKNLMPSLLKAVRECLEEKPSSL